MTLFSTVLRWIASTPPATQVAPIRPPNSACEELEGSPMSQVVRFHMIAPTSPAKITTGVISVSLTSPPEIVFATSTDRNAPTRFRQPAIPTATFGRSAPVAIDVAIAFAVSWKPFVKSKTNAVTTTTTTINDRSMTVPFDRPTATRPVYLDPPTPGHADPVEGASPGENERAARSGIGGREPQPDSLSRRSGRRPPRQ